MARKIITKERNREIQKKVAKRVKAGKSPTSWVDSVAYGNEEKTRQGIARGLKNQK